MSKNEHLIVVCYNYDLSWDLDYDPPACENCDHDHDLLVITDPEEDS